MKKLLKIILAVLFVITVASCDTSNKPISSITREEAEAIRNCADCKTRDDMQNSIKPLIGERVQWTSEIAKVFKGEPAFGRGDWIVTVWYDENREKKENYTVCILEDIPPDIINALESRDVITFEGTIFGLLDDKMFPFWILKDVKILSTEKYIP
jgi:hypothetical protein